MLRGSVPLGILVLVDTSVWDGGGGGEMVVSAIVEKKKKNR